MKAVYTLKINTVQVNSKANSYSFLSIEKFMYRVKFTLHQLLRNDYERPTKLYVGESDQ